MKIAITGCGRSGTTYCAKVLQALGFDVGHEEVGRDGISSWQLASNAETSLGNYSPREVLLDASSLYHVTRSPLSAIGSAQTFTHQSWAYICEHSPCRMVDELPERCAAYWYFWNELTEIYVPAENRFRVEEFPLQPFIELATHEITPEMVVTAAAIPTSTNTRASSYKLLTWKDIKEWAPKIKRTAQAYGYDL